MDCTAVAENLVAFHVGAIENVEREAIEEHLVGCRACIETYMSIKRAADLAERPRPEVRDRLRAEVLATFPKKSEAPKPARVAFFRRRIPLYQGVALAAIAAAITLAAPSFLRRVQRSNAPPAPMIDTSRTHAESLTIY